MYETLASITLRTYIYALIVNAIASVGPASTFYSYGMDCKDDDAVCKNNKRWYLIAGIFFVVLAFIVSVISFYMYKI
jgi:hypothetical protein